MGSKELEKWADIAMYKSQPTPESNMPTVHLLHMTEDPLGVLAKACRLFEGKLPPERGGGELTDDERRRYFEQMAKTKLSSPLEYITFLFFFDGVPRWWTHQMVRNRMSSYVQESLRFATIQADEDPGGWPGRVEYPPSLNGLNDDDPRKSIWTQTVKEIGRAYNMLVSSGVPAEDARGLLPIATKTRIHVHINLRSLIDTTGSRLTTQAQFQWRYVVSQMIKAIREYNLPVSQQWQLDLIASRLRPECYRLGRCAFRADMDRHCSIRERVEDFHDHGISSDHWDEGATVTGADGLPRRIEAIQPWEWLADPSAARIRPGQVAEETEEDK